MQKTFGQKLRELRVKKTEISLRKLAETVGITPAYLSRIECGRDLPPSEDVIIRIARALDINEDELLSYANKVSPDLLKTIREKPDLFPDFIRSVSNYDETRLEDIIELIQFIQSRSLRMKKSEWKHREKIIRDLLNSNLKKQDCETIRDFIQKMEQSTT